MGDKAGGVEGAEHESRQRVSQALQGSRADEFSPAQDDRRKQQDRHGEGCGLHGMTCRDRGQQPSQDHGGTSGKATAWARRLRAKGESRCARMK